MGLKFFEDYSAHRLAGDSASPERWNPPPEQDDENRDNIDWSVEVDSENWTAIPVNQVTGWEQGSFSDSPVIFVDGKDVGRTIAWVRSPDGYPVPVRLAEIGGVAMRYANSELRRECSQVEIVLSLPVDPFPWQEIERLGAALQEMGIRLLPAVSTDQSAIYDYSRLSKVTDHRTRDEMLALEEIMLAQTQGMSAVVDGRLEPHKAGFNRATSPVFGVIKTHYQTYLHPKGIRLLYELKGGQRTPTFVLQPAKRLTVLSWYIRLTEGLGVTPDWGFIRVEISWEWYKAQNKNTDFINRLSRVLYEYRHHDGSYDRAAVSLHPIVRAEESLGSLFPSLNTEIQRFYRQIGI